MSPAHEFHTLVKMALADGRLAPQERDLLLRCAEWLGLPRAEAAWVLSCVMRGLGPASVVLPTGAAERERLFNGLVNVAIADGVVAPEEERCLQALGASFGVDPSLVPGLLQRARDQAVAERTWPPGWSAEGPARSTFGGERLQPGSTVAGRFVLRELMGVGGFGRVFRAHHMELGEDVALKVLRFRLEGDAEAEERFRHEVKVARSFVHRYAVPIREFGRDPTCGCLYFTMDLVEGMSLDTTLDREGRLEPERAARVCCQALKALEEAHGRGLIHRDLKPANMMLTEGRSGEEEVRLLDFGIALALELAASTSHCGEEGGEEEDDEQRIGTLAYMSPEQAEGRRLDGRSDLYSMGVVLYELLSGHLPIEADLDTKDVRRSFLDRILSRAPEPLEADVRLQEVIRIALEKDPKRRFQSAALFREALERASRPRRTTRRFGRKP